LLKASVNGPLPPLAVSEVQTTVSPALNPPLPGEPQLHCDAGHTTEVRLPPATRVPVIVMPPAEFAMIVDDSWVASGPTRSPSEKYNRLS